jgi:protein phosphatase
MSDETVQDSGSANAGAVPVTEAPSPGPSSAAPRERVITIPNLALVVLIGSSGSGKSTFGARHFRPSEVLSSDHYREVVGDDPNDLSVTTAAFDALHHVAGLRLALGRLTVVDATSVKPQDRASLVHIAREHDVLPVAIVLNLDERVCVARNRARPDRQFGPQVVRNHIQMLRRGLRGLEREGFRGVFVLNTPAAVEAVRVERAPLFTDRRTDTGPFDVVGDLHGCYDELIELLELLGYQQDAEAGMRHPDGRRVVYLGDLVDRGPKVVETLSLVRRMVAAGQALCVPGNHDDKLKRWLEGRNVHIAHGLAESIAQIEAIPAEERDAWKRAMHDFLDGLISHFVLDGGRLVVAHAGMKEAYQGRASSRVREFALYGETTGETDEFGLPMRANWAADYRGSAAVIYGHTPVFDAAWLNNTINIDTGCVFGGRLTALRWPERELVSVPARAVYAQPKRPLQPAATDGGTGQAPDTLLRIEDVQGKQIVETRLARNVIVEADRAAAALEVMSRFALDPRWLIYLPPTMSPSETSGQPGLLEHPAEAFAYYRQNGVPRVVCEEKHMGSRAVLVLCRDAETAARRFGVPAEAPPGACYTRTGRRFLEDDALDRALLTRLSAALGRTGFWERFTSDWVCLDAEILPWSAKAQGLLREQYAPVAAAGSAALTSALAAAEAAEARGVTVAPLLERLRARSDDLARYADAYRRYCWDVAGLEGMRVAPFHLLATEGATYFDRDHLWHMRELVSLAEADPLFMATEHRAVSVLDPDECTAAASWWEELTARGGEGMVVKPLEFIVRGNRGLVQPAVKCRGPEYLRIIYGPDYTEPANLDRLRKRGLSAKRGLAVREFALGVEALERFVRREPLWRVHQAVFAVLALESEPVDPRL